MASAQNAPAAVNSPKMPIGTPDELQRLVEMAEEVAGVGYWRVDAASREITWSAQVARILGLDPDQVDRDLASVFEFYHPDDRAIARAHMESAITSGLPFSFELRLIRLDGELRHVACKGAAEQGPEGQVLAVFGAFMDVTESRQAEEALRASETHHRLFADNATDLIMLSNVDHRLTYISPSVERVTGYSPELLVGRPLISLVHADDGPAMQAISERLYREGPGAEPPRIEYRARHRDGRWLWFETRTSLLRDPATGEPTGCLDVAREITARKTLEAELQERTREAQAAAQAKSDFLANMSHEIRTPLTAILGFSALLRQLDGLPDAAGAHLRRITTAGETLLAVVNDVLDFSKLDAGLLELDPQAFDPAALLRETADLVAGQAAMKRLSLDVALDDELPAAVIADGARLRQVLLNLLGNAIKFTEAGGVKIHARYDAEAGGRLRIAVSDTGAGVPADRRDRLFQRFSQVDGSVSRHHGGTGLGLAICKRLVELMGGDIGVDSIVGGGSTFWFTITAPAARIEARDEVVAVAAMPSRRILVVDDLAVNRELIRAVLGPFNHDIHEAGGGQEAVEIAHRTAFDLILMDLQMPGMDGLAATRVIRATAEPNHRTPIIAVSADVLSEHFASYEAAGVNDHIAKPIDFANLIGKVAHWSRHAHGDAGGNGALEANAG